MQCPYPQPLLLKYAPVLKPGAFSFSSRLCTKSEIPQTAVWGGFKCFLHNQPPSAAKRRIPYTGSVRIVQVHSIYGILQFRRQQQINRSNLNDPQTAVWRISLFVQSLSSLFARNPSAVLPNQRWLSCQRNRTTWRPSTLFSPGWPLEIPDRLR